MMTLPRPIRGIIPPVLTPLLDRDAFDTAAFERLLEHLIDGGVSALFILGSTGEAPGLSYRFRREVIDCACKVAGTRIPILVGITDTAFVESVFVAEYAAKAGASALVLSAPYYYTLSQSAFCGYLERLAPALPLPLYLYNMPSYTKFIISPETVAIAASIPNIYGLKDSSGDRVMSENQICVKLQGLPLAPQPGVTERYIANTRLLTLA
jgi:dihydrodipicolinate synthase/N-acetylneuraminate lyase